MGLAKNSLIYILIVVINIYSLYCQTEPSPQPEGIDDKREVILKVGDDTVRLASSGRNEVFWSDYDKFKDETTVWGLVHLINCGGDPNPVLHWDIGIKYSFRGTKLSLPQNVTLMYRRFGRSFDGNPEALAIVDDKRISLGNMFVEDKSQLAVDIYLYYQLLWLTMPFETFKSLATGKSLEVKIGNYELNISHEINFVLPMFQKMLSVLEKPMSALPPETSTEPQRVSGFFEVSSDRVGFLDIPLKTNGFIEVTDYYTGDYSDARLTHYSFSISDASNKNRIIGWLYMKRGPEAEMLRKELLSSATKRLLGSFTFVIKKERFKAISSSFTAELIGYSNPEK